MINYKSPHSSLFLVLALLSACTLNADVHDNNLNEPDPSNAGGTGGSAPLPSGGSAGENVGGSAGVGGSEAGSAGEGGFENYPDAGVAGSAGEAGTGNTPNDGGTDPDTVVRECDTPEAIGSDKDNWFTTNSGRVGLNSHWFQLIDADGFSNDGCTYVGQIKWYRPVVDQLGYTWYESGGMYDEPATVFTINFTADGLVAAKNVPVGPGIYPGMDFSYETCYPAFPNLIPQERYSSNAEYWLHGCIRDYTGGHTFIGPGMFRGTWDDDFSKPILLSPLPGVLIPL